VSLVGIGEIAESRVSKVILLFLFDFYR